ncbi:HalOD1 output domain-containing protein [Natronosalvus vescus]|uniref:HalOD1 output domain-containing protein n=1 Tax=Natronosalvus vescus TaxID=2953881 RepID=UPI00209071A5|nr:HalOD1 output domain-containing protein [Natronosalvus vescus]
MSRFEKTGGSTGTPHHRYDRPADESPSEAVVIAVAAATGKTAAPTAERPEALPPLYDAIDPEALDALFSSTGTRSRECTIAFTYEGCSVVVEDDQVIIELEG